MSPYLNSHTSTPVLVVDAGPKGFFAALNLAQSKPVHRGGHEGDGWRMAEDGSHELALQGDFGTDALGG